MYKDEITAVGNDASNQVKESEARTTKQIDDLKKDENEKIKALWEYLIKESSKQ
jgi:hypothetical protein